MDFLLEMEKYISLIDGELYRYLAKTYPESIFEAMEYALFPGGKRLRPLLVLGACAGLGGNAYNALPFACAVEMIHAYSLIHDDLPALDNDDFRRGKPSCHKRFGEAMAILAGDALLNTAYEVMADACVKNITTEAIRAMNTVAAAAGVRGMVAGQVSDIEHEGRPVTEAGLMFIHKNKTAALIGASIAAGALTGGAHDAEPYLAAGEELGIAFQIMDDILDVVSSQEILGKPVLSDEKSGKNTYISVFGMERAKEDYQRYSESAVNRLSSLFGTQSFIVKLAVHTGNRIK